MSGCDLSNEPKICLTVLEKGIFAKVCAACEYHQLETTVRVAGGWVRDKLLGLESTDIDLVVDNMTGEKFATLLTDYLSMGQNERVPSIGVIRRNPEQSKHLETATVKVDGTMLDISNLRTETYQEDSRIPEIKVGTPEEDALRRDFTINALYYNLHDQRIEDFTCQGLDDLKLTVVRTPLDPYQTFLEDPLRVLRAARIAAKLKFTVAPLITTAASDKRIWTVLSEKVSRERFGIEIKKILSSDNPYLALKYICDWGLGPIIFQLPEQLIWSKDALGEFDSKHVRPDFHDKKLIGAMLGTVKQVPVRLLERLKEQQRHSLLYGAFLSPLYGWMTQKKRRMEPLIQWVVVESIKQPANKAKLATAFLDAAMSMRYIAASDFRSKDDKVVGDVRVLTGRMLARIHSIQDGDWTLATVLAEALEHADPEKLQTLRNYISWVGMGSGLQMARSLGSEGKSKLFFSGSDLAQQFKIRGCVIGVLLSKQQDWQYRHPSGSKEECLEFLSNLVKETIK